MRPKGSKEFLEDRRRRAVALLKAGASALEVARAVSTSPASVYRWKKAYQLEGDRGLDSKPSPGAKPKLSAEQCGRLREILLEGPLLSGYTNQLWTLRRVAEVIKKHFDVTYNITHVWRLLRRLGFSCKKPQRRARQRDEQAIRQWVAKDWPRIKKGLLSRV